MWDDCACHCVLLKKGIMFYLAIDQNIQVHTLHPGEAEALFQLLERNRPRLRPWIHPSALPETITATRKLTIESFLNSLPDPNDTLAEYQDYFQERDRYIPPPNPPMEMGIWVNDILAGEIMLGRLQDSLTAAEFGYWLDDRREGQGIIIRCVSGLMEYAIDNLGIERFVIGCALDNLRSRAIPERLGYRLLARVPAGEMVGDFVYDRMIYGIQSTDWRERGKAGMPVTDVLDSRSR
jgi:ribosomal-protein-serine acetyltransferase